MTKLIKVVQPRDGEILQVPDQPVSMKYGVRDGKVIFYKFIFQNGGILYVPIPRDSGTDDDITLGAVHA